MSLPPRPDVGASWRRRLRDAAPMLTGLEVRLLSIAFANPDGTPDSLLVLADAVEETARENCLGEVRKQLRAVADMARDTAAFRAERGKS